MIMPFQKGNQLQKGKSPWNKGLKGVKTSDSGRTPWNKGKKATTEAIKHQSESHLNYKPTEKTKIKISKTMMGLNKGIIPSPKCGHGKRTYYDSSLQGRVCFRSSYELAYAKYLDKNHILWTYETETFDLGDTTYTPDFFLPTSNLFVEIKGYMHPEAQIKINKFYDLYPEECLQILRKNNLIKLGCEL